MNDFNTEPNTTVASSKGAWYTESGVDDDVVCSTRVRLARNLATFPFPSKLTPGDKQRVQNLVFQAFEDSFQDDSYQKLSMDSIELLGKRILAERGVLSQEMLNKNDCGLVIRNDGKISSSINVFDHLHLSSFSTGLSTESAYNLVSDVDSALQTNLEFASSTDIGYLTYRIKDAGTGAKFSVMLHLPSLTHANQHIKEFKSLVFGACDIFACYTTTTSDQKEVSALGSYYRIVTNSSFPMSEPEQIMQINSICEHLIDVEREVRLDLVTNSPTVLRNKIFRSLGIIQFSRFISLAEGIELVSALKWGLDLNFFNGVERATLYALLYRIQPAHLAFVIRSSNLKFERDIQTPEQKMDRLRSLILQEAIAPLNIV